MRLSALIFALLIIAARSHSASAMIPDSAVTDFDEIRRYEVGFAYRNKPEQHLPVGWTGAFEEESGVACFSDGIVDGKNAWLLHCPWLNGTGITFQQFAFSLPKVNKISLSGFTAMRPQAIGKSDGAIFRIYVNGSKLFEESSLTTDWKPFELDLTQYAGRDAVIRFETDPGPKDNPGWDFTIWGDRKLTLDGFYPKPKTHPGPPTLDLSKMTPRKRSSVPVSGFKGKTSVELAQGAASLKYVGADGTLEYSWRPPTTLKDPLLGKFKLRARMIGDSPVELDLANGSRASWTGKAELLSSKWSSSPDSITLTHDLTVDDKPVKMTITGRIVDKSLVLDVSCSAPVIKLLDNTGWLPAMRANSVVTPYYSGQVKYLPHENIFVNAFLDWTASSASALDSIRAGYSQLTDGSRNLLKERVIYTAAWHPSEVLPCIPNPTSPFIKTVGDKIVLDIWGGKFRYIADQLQALHSLGIDKCIVLIHNWQRSGYDNALPMHYPAQADMGGDEDMKYLVATAKKLGYLISLHENYADYYPNYDFFDVNDIAQDAKGEKQEAWYNPGTRIQSFAVKPNAIMRFAHEQSPEIYKRYRSNSNYLDVHSAGGPWFHVDLNAKERGAGMFRRVFDAHSELFAFERKTFGGPVFGEGNVHWYWSGLLDGVEAQFGTGWGHKQGPSAPLAVDFDLLRIHPLQINHGMGYYQRWADNLGGDKVPPMQMLDQYRMQEMIFGHNGFIGQSTWELPGLVWLEHHLTTPVSEKHSGAKVVDIRYEIGGKWVDSAAAAKIGTYDRVKAVYSNGLKITANNSTEPMRIGDRTLQQYGWLAEGAGVTAGTFLDGNNIIDYAETKDSIFANARSSKDWSFAWPQEITPVVSSFKQTAPGEFQATYSWDVNDIPDKDYRALVHFDYPGIFDEVRIACQQDHNFSTPASQWKSGVFVDGPYSIKLPADIEDGDYPWYTGLFAPDGRRLLLTGLDDGSCRIRLGTLKVRDSGAVITFEPQTSRDDQKIYPKNVNDQVPMIDFGKLRTDASVLLRKESGDWVLRVWPDRPTTVEISSKSIKMPKQVDAIGGAGPIVPESQGDWWRLKVGGATQYRWKDNQ